MGPEVEHKPHGSPLLEIQRCEAEVASLVAAAEENASIALNETRRKVAGLKRRASSAGQADGRTEFENILAEARIEANHILDQANEQSDTLRLRREEYLERMVQYALGIIFEFDEEVDFG